MKSLPGAVATLCLAVMVTGGVEEVDTAPRRGEIRERVGDDSRCHFKRVCSDAFTTGQLGIMGVVHGDYGRA